MPRRSKRPRAGGADYVPIFTSESQRVEALAALRRAREQLQDYWNAAGGGSQVRQAADDLARAKAAAESAQQDCIALREEVKGLKKELRSAQAAAKAAQRAADQASRKAHAADDLPKAHARVEVGVRADVLHGSWCTTADRCCVQMCLRLLAELTATEVTTMDDVEAVR